MNDKTIEAIVASPPERDELVVQLFLRGGGQWAEIYCQDGLRRIEIYQQADGQPWKFPLDEVLHVLTLAHQQVDG